MRMIFFSLLSLLILNACNNPHKKAWYDNIPTDDITCLNAVKEAKKDIAKGKLSFCHIGGGLLFNSLRSENEMDSLLKSFGLCYKDELLSDFIIEGQTQGCYANYMNEMIANKFGVNFIDSLLYVADSLYVLKSSKEIFDNIGRNKQWDTPPSFSADSNLAEIYHSALQRRFDEIVQYPEGYRYKAKYNSAAGIKLDIYIDEKGKATVTNTQFIFWDNNTEEEDYNKKYRNYFRSILIPLIETTIWTPAKIKNIAVKSQYSTILNLK